MKVLFLDIDGVLNNGNTKEIITVPLGDFTGIDAKLLKLFQDWKAKRPNVNIVLSSTWRNDERFTDHLRTLGLSWIDQTANLGTTRGIEIGKWLGNHLDVTHFAIVDDVSNMRPLTNHLVQTSPKHGIRDKDLKKIDILLDIHVE